MKRTQVSTQGCQSVNPRVVTKLSIDNSNLYDLSGISMVSTTKLTRTFTSQESIWRL